MDTNWQTNWQTKSLSKLLEFEVEPNVGDVVQRALTQVEPNQLVRNRVFVPYHASMGTAGDLVGGDKRGRETC